MTLDLAQHSSLVAPLLLGSAIHAPNGTGRIVEVEAYGGAEDAASHAHKGPTPRSAPMFGYAGTLYVYLIYGMHHCANVVTGAFGDGQAVLIRGVEPIGDTSGLERARPAVRRRVDLTNGPGKLCVALGIDRSHCGVDLCDASSAVRLELATPVEPAMVVQSTRIGISLARELPWRWYLRDNDWVSKQRP